MGNRKINIKWEYIMTLILDHSAYHKINLSQFNVIPNIKLHIYCHCIPKNIFQIPIYECLLINYYINPYLYEVYKY